MNNLIKNTFIFTIGATVGFVFCGLKATEMVLKSDTLRTALIDKIVNDVLYGEDVKSKKPNYISYSSYKQKRERDINDYKYSYVFDSLNDAEIVSSKLTEIFDLYGVLTVYDVNELCAIKSTFKDCNLGWLNKEQLYKKLSIIKRDGRGYCLNLPLPDDLNNRL